MYWACKAISDEMSDCLNKHATQKDFDREKATFLQERNEFKNRLEDGSAEIKVRGKKHT